MKYISMLACAVSLSLASCSQEQNSLHEDQYDSATDLNVELQRAREESLRALHTTFELVQLDGTEVYWNCHYEENSVHYLKDSGRIPVTELRRRTTPDEPARLEFVDVPCASPAHRRRISLSSENTDEGEHLQLDPGNWPSLTYRGHINETFFTLISALNNEFIDRRAEFERACIFNNNYAWREGSDGDMWLEQRDLDPLYVERFCREAASESVNPRLFIDSPGGEIYYAFQAVDLMVQAPWQVHVSADDRCYSACIFIFAAADYRTAADHSLGIHRIYTPDAEISSLADLSTALEPVVDHARRIMTTNGISPRIVDDMMSIASIDVRTLSHEEKFGYGLVPQNSASRDLRRMRTEQLCGEGFTSRMNAARRSARECINGGVRFAETLENACLEAALQQHGFPDARCPLHVPNLEGWHDH